LDPIYNKPFEDLVQRAMADPRVGRVVRFIDDVVPTILSPPLTLRDDGRLFLGLNIAWLVTFPWEEVHPGQPFLAQHARLLRSDLVTILQDAALFATRQGQSEVTSHMLLKSVDQNYGRLNILSFNMWG